MDETFSRRSLLRGAVGSATCGWLGGMSTSALAGTSELRIAFIPYENPQQLVRDIKPVGEFLGQKLGVKVTPSVVLDYAAVVEALRSNRADLAFMGSLQYLMAHQQCGATAILGEKYNGKPTYVAKIFVRADSGIKSVSDLRGKRMAFVDPISSSGYLYPLAVFRKAQVMPAGQKPEQFFKRVYFAGGDEQAIRAVYNGFADGAGIGEYSHQLLRPEERDKVVSIAESEPIPSHCIVARAGLGPAMIAKIQNLFLSLEKGENRKYLKALYNVDGYVRVTHKTYAPVEALAKEHGLLK
jgi:phosphonate transport system substrate-binding protein